MTIIGEGVAEPGGRTEKINVSHQRPGPNSEDPIQMYYIAKKLMHRNFFN